MENSDTSGQYVPFDRFLQQYQAAHSNGNNSLISNSTLLPTAPEFIPNQTNHTGAIPKQGNKHDKHNAYKKRNWQSRNSCNDRGQYHNFKTHNQENSDNCLQLKNTKDKENYQKDSYAVKTITEKIFPKRKYMKRKPITNDYSKCSQREKLIKEIEKNVLDCMVCCELIRSTQSIWSCLTCYHIFHLKCIRQWETSSRGNDGMWRCPACQSPKTVIPKDYYCFCGKMKNPPLNKSDISSLAHSCGSICGTYCESQHPCTILCHPGPHPECQAFIEKKCFCGKLSKVMQCSQKEDLHCEAICDKLLNCNVHRCSKNCHESCAPCQQKLIHSCFCGKVVKTVDCNLENNLSNKFSCEQDCGKLLECGNHVCSLKCHDANVKCETCKLR